MTEIIEENGNYSAESREIGSFSFSPACVICGAGFERSGRSRKTTCSDTCDRERRRIYGAAYRQLGRDLQARMLDRFAGRIPSEDEIFEMLQAARATGKTTINPTKDTSHER